MIALILTLAVLLAVGSLLGIVVGLRRKIRDMQQFTADTQCSGAEELTAMQASHVRLDGKNRQLQTQINDLQQELATLSYSISHDLRAPLRSVHGFSQALAEDYGPRLDGTAHDYLRRVRSSAQHMDALIDDLLALARIIRAPLQVEPVDLSALAKEVAAELAVSEPKRRVDWDIQPNVTAQGDRALLTVVLRHLLGNAWKFSAVRPVARIVLRVRQPEGDVAGTVYEVRDNGVGFDMQYAGKLFGVFQRMCAADEFPGRGVGLATVQRIIRRHGGYIRASAEVDQGAVFSFTLEAEPIKAASQEMLPRMVATVPNNVPTAPQPKTSTV